jgi:hypothetical protein
LPALQSLDKSWWPKNPKNSSYRAQTQANSSSLSEKPQETTVQEAAPVAPAILHSSSKNRRPRHRKNRPTGAKTQMQSGVIVPTEQEPIADEIFKDFPQQSFLYVVRLPTLQRRSSACLNDYQTQMRTLQHRERCSFIYIFKSYFEEKRYY